MLEKYLFSSYQNNPLIKNFNYCFSRGLDYLKNSFYFIRNILNFKYFSSKESLLEENDQKKIISSLDNLVLDNFDIRFNSSGMVFRKK